MSRPHSHPLASRPAPVSLGRYAKAEAPAPPRSALPPKVEGRHRWVSLSWHAVTETQVRAVERGARISPNASTLVAVTVGCYDCHLGYAVAADQPCQPGPPPPAPLEPASPEPVPVNPPTPPDAEPPIVELSKPASVTALTP
jgi:hypothetical protein